MCRNEIQICRKGGEDKGEVIVREGDEDGSSVALAMCEGKAPRVTKREGTR